MKSPTVMPSVKKRAMVCGVEPLDVIAFQEGVHDQLPVRRHVVEPAAEEMVAGEAEGVEFGRERVGVGEVAILAREPDQPARLARRQLLADDGRPCRARERCRAAACRRARRRARRSRRDRGRRCAGTARRRSPSISRVPRCRQTFQKTWATPCLSRVSSSGHAEAVMGDRHVRPRAAAPRARSPAAAGRTAAPSRRRSGPDRYRPRPAPW